MFVKRKKSLDSLPPTKDALRYHIERANTKPQYGDNHLHLNHKCPVQLVVDGLWTMEI